MHRTHHVTATAWLLAGLATMAVDPLAAARSTQPYSFVGQAISDLGVTRCGPVVAYGGGEVEVCSPWHGLVAAGWVLSGLVTAVLVWGLRERLGLHRSGSVLVSLSGLLLAGVGAVPADVNLGLHAILGGAGFLLQNIALVVVGRHHRASADWRRWAPAEVSAGAIGLLATFLMLLPPLTDVFGLIERVAAYPFPLWLVASALALLRRRPRKRPVEAS